MLSQIAFTVNDQPVKVPDDGCSLLEALRDRVGIRSVKDGCSPQGQCGCCTVLVDGQPRVACVTPAARIAGRSITTVEGLADADAWATRFCAAGASQCGFCTPGIIVRLSARPANPGQALLAHLCRCTGWQTIMEAAASVTDGTGDIGPLADRRASIEGRSPQMVSPSVALGRGGFADDTAPEGALVAARSDEGTWFVGETLTAARAAAGKVQGRRTTVALNWPIDPIPGVWHRQLQTTWVEPGYLEPDAAWCLPGGEPVAVLANGGAFGGKLASDVTAVARRLADEHSQAVRVAYSREDVVRLGPKRPPLAAAIRTDGTGVVHVRRTDEIAAAINSVAPGFDVIEIDVPGPPTSVAVRAAGWAEAAVLLSSLRDGPDVITSPDGATATAWLDDVGTVHVRVRCGQVLSATVLRSYCIGAAHQALGWVRSEGIYVDAESGEVHDLTIRSFGILRAVDMPRVEVAIEEDDAEPVNGSDAVFAAVAAAAWRQARFPARWPYAR